jgi:uncharacterized protein
MSDSVNGAAFVDVDLVPQRASFDRIADQMEPSWRAYLRVDADTSAEGLLTYKLPESSYWAPGAHDITEGIGWTVEETTAYLDRAGIGQAVLNPGTAAAISGLNLPDLAAELARATNEWTAKEWLHRDERFYGSILVAPHDPAAAAAEIRRAAAAHPKMVQVVIAYPRHFIGSDFFTAIHAAADELKLPLSLQGNSAFTGINIGYAAGGYPESMIEFQAVETYGAQPHVASVVGQGVFDRFPDLRLVVNGFGAAWLPSLVWALDAACRDLTDEAARLGATPSEYIGSFVRLGTRGLEAPAANGDLGSLLELVDGERLLLASSNGQGAPAGVPESWMPRVRGENARELFDFARA